MATARCGQRSYLLALHVASLAIGLWSCHGDAAVNRPRPTLRYITYTGTGVFQAELAERLRSAMPDIEVITEPAAGSFAVVSALEEGRGDFGFATADVVYLAYRRGTEAAPQPHANLSAIAVRWVNGMHLMVPRESGIQRVVDLKGQRLGVVPAGSSAELFARIMLEAHGLAYSDVRPIFIPPDRMAAALQNDVVDGALVEFSPTRDAPLPANPTRHLRTLPIHSGVINKIRDKYPFAKPVSVKDTISRAEVETIGVNSVLICRKDLSEDLAYVLTREVVALLTETARTRDLGPRFNPSHAPATPIPLHPGAARYHREREILH